MNHLRESCRAGFFLGMALIAVALIPLGCVTTPERMPAAGEPSDGWPAPREPKVILQPGDELTVKFSYWPELDEAQKVRPDGKISLQLVGDVGVQGLSPEELRQHLLDVYSDKLKDPEITVIVTSFGSHRVYVGGEVRTPGVLMMTGRMTALEAVMQAGGFLPQTAKMRNVVIVRERDGKQYARTLDLRRPLEKPESDVFYLEPYDVVFVPQTNIDKVDQWVEQYINRIIPRNIHATFGYSRLRTDDDTTRTPVTPVSVNVTGGAK